VAISRMKRQPDPYLGVIARDHGNAISTCPDRAAQVAKY
jgi:hypothetical protein